MTSSSNHFDLIVIGSGAAGSSSWYRARQLAKSVAVFEGDVLGGECPTFACVPTKALLHCAEVYETMLGGSAFGIDAGQVTFDYARIKARKDLVVSQTGAALGEQPYRDMGVHLVQHNARFVASDAVEAGGERYTAERFLIATGSSQRLPDVKGLAEAGYLTFKEAIDLTELPRSMFILGGGPVGCEFAQLFSTFGVEVTIADHNERLLSKEDEAVGDFLRPHFKKRGVRVLTGATVQNVTTRDGQKHLTLEQDGRKETIAVDEILVATGKNPNTDLGLDTVGIVFNEDGITVDDTLRTTNPRVYAAGDVAGPFRFTHAASYQGNIAALNMFTAETHRVDYAAMPRCMFTAPEVACVGLTEKEAREKDLHFHAGMSKVSDTDRGLTSEQREGFVKVIVEADSGRIAGATIVSARAGEMIHELGLAMSLGATAQQVAGLLHAFPTFSEAVRDACADALG